MVTPLLAWTIVGESESSANVVHRLVTFSCEIQVFSTYSFQIMRVGRYLKRNEQLPTHSPQSTAQSFPLYANGPEDDVYVLNFAFGTPRK